MTNVLLVGESWVTAATHYKGFDQFGSVSFHLGAEPLVKALAGSEFALTYMPAHEAAEGFPFEGGGLAAFDAIILSDIGSNTLLLPPQVYLRSQTAPNRLKLIRGWVAEGGGLLMCGGYFSFQGIDGRARWRRTPVEDVLPVTCLPYDDRLEMPEGCVAEVLAPGHPVLSGIGAPGRRCSAPTRWWRSPKRRSWRGCRRTRAAIRCSFSAPTAGAAPPPGPATSARTGCRRSSARGRATGASGATCSAGWPAARSVDRRHGAFAGSARRAVDLAAGRWPNRMERRRPRGFPDRLASAENRIDDCRTSGHQTWRRLGADGAATGRGVRPARDTGDGRRGDRRAAGSRPTTRTRSSSTG